MNKYGIKVSEEQNRPELDVSLDSGMFVTKSELVLPKKLRERIITALEKGGQSAYRDLKNIRIALYCEENMNRNGSVLGNSYFEAISPDKEGKYMSFINDFDVFLANYFEDYAEIKESAKLAVIEEFGEDILENSYSLGEKIKCLCDIAQNVLDKQTNEERFVRYFGGEKGNPTYALTLSLDEEFDDVYEIEVQSVCDGEVGTGYITDINGADELAQALIGISNGTCRVMAKEFSDKPIICTELYAKTVEKFNSLQEKAHKKQNEMRKD